MIEVFEYIAFGLGAVTFGWWAWRAGSLSAVGSIAAVTLGLVVTLTAGVGWLLPLFLFFLSSNLLGRLFPTALISSDAKDKQARDAVQVLCNGGVYGLVALLDLDPTLLLIAMAVATADTWASEVGKYFRQPTVDILRLRRVPPGLSGGISTAGNLGGAAGASLIGSAGFLLISTFTAGDFAAVVVFGFLGMLLDSLLGAGLQPRYRDPSSGVLSDVRPPGGELVSGYRPLTNDAVNLLAGTLTVGVAVLLT